MSNDIPWREIVRSLATHADDLVRLLETGELIDHYMHVKVTAAYVRNMREHAQD